MVNYVEVIIGNRLDDNTRSRIFCFDSSDKNTSKYLTDILDLHLDLCEWSYEYVIRHRFIKITNLTNIPVQ